MKPRELETALFTLQHTILVLLEQPTAGFARFAFEGMETNETMDAVEMVELQIRNLEILWDRLYSELCVL